jgi:hypothetical protein
VCRPQTCPECGCVLGYRAAVCDTCHEHYETCTGPGGRPGFRARHTGDEKGDRH